MGNTLISSVPPWLMLQFLPLGFFLGFCSWWTVSCYVKQSLSFSICFCSWMVFITIVERKLEQRHCVTLCKSGWKVWQMRKRNTHIHRAPVIYTSLKLTKERRKRKWEKKTKQTGGWSLKSLERPWLLMYKKQHRKKGLIFLTVLRCSLLYLGSQDRNSSIKYS